MPLLSPIGSFNRVLRENKGKEHHFCRLLHNVLSASEQRFPPAAPSPACRLRTNVRDDTFDLLKATSVEINFSLPRLKAAAAKQQKYCCTE
jgi:hypothetical protein